MPDPGSARKLGQETSALLTIGLLFASLLAVVWAVRAWSSWQTSIDLRLQAVEARVVAQDERLRELEQKLQVHETWPAVQK